MRNARPDRSADDSTDQERSVFDRREFGRLLRLFGPLMQLPLLWVFLKNPLWVQEYPEVIYGGMILGFLMVLVGILLSRRR